jgi:hypothetical protein
VGRVRPQTSTMMPALVMLKATAKQLSHLISFPSREGILCTDPSVTARGLRTHLLGVRLHQGLG